MAPAGQPSNAVLLERVNALQCDLQEINAEMRKFFDEIRKFQLSYTESHTALVLRVNQTDARLDALEKLVGKLTGDMNRIMPVYRAVTWIAAILGASVIALIWSLITGQATIVLAP